MELLLKNVFRHQRTFSKHIYQTNYNQHRAFLSSFHSRKILSVKEPLYSTQQNCKLYTSKLINSTPKDPNVIDLDAKEKTLINLENDKKRQQIGFEQETVLDSGWKPIQVDKGKLLGYYSKLSKRNLTGKNHYFYI